MTEEEKLGYSPTPAIGCSRIRIGGGYITIRSPHNDTSVTVDDLVSPKHMVLGKDVEELWDTINRIEEKLDKLIITIGDKK